MNPSSSVRTLAAALSSVLLWGCADGDGAGAPGSGAEAATAGFDRPAVASLERVVAPAGVFSGEPNLTVGPDGAYLSWLERSETGHALRFARWTGSGWAEPRTVIDRPDLFVNWADFPSLAALEDGTLVAHWLEKSGPGTYAYDVRMAISRDGGDQWSDDVVPHRDGVEAEHGFVSLLPLDGELGAAWLDGRETVDGRPMTLRYTTLRPDGTLGPEEVVDTSTCDCCQTALARSDAGILLAYRDRTPDEVRDVYVSRRVDGRWEAGVPVHRDGWVIPGCPVNGPALGAAGERAAVTWFTGAPLDPDADRDAVRQAGERGRVLAAFSTDGGRSFSAPVRVDDGRAMGRVDLELLEDGTALVVWLERVDGAAEVRVRRVGPEGVGPAVTVAGAEAGRASGFPRMARLDDTVFFAWTEAGDPPRVRTATARIPAAGGAVERADAAGAGEGGGAR